jgi:CheY-like chemotaxis protein
MTNDGVATVLFLSSDLMFSSRVMGAAKALGASVQLVADPSALPDKLTADCRLALVDLSLERLNLPAAVSAIRAGAPAARIIAYGAHVEQAALADAAEAGCDQVLTRGQFNQQYAEVLKAAV